MNALNSDNINKINICVGGGGGKYNIKEYK